MRPVSWAMCFHPGSCVSLSARSNQAMSGSRLSVIPASPAGVAAELTDHQVGTRFKNLHEFMARVRVPEGPTKTPDASARPLPRRAIR